MILRYGWKTILGTLILAVGQLMRLDDSLEPFAPIADAAGIALGGIGIRLAISKQGDTK